MQLQLNCSGHSSYHSISSYTVIHIYCHCEFQGDSDSDDDDLENDQSTLRLINELLYLLSSGVDEECSICLDSLVDPVITRCVHAFCQRCISDVINSDILESRCPLCRAPVNENELVKVPEQRRKEKSDKEKERCAGNEWKSSTKVR